MKGGKGGKGGKDGKDGREHHEGRERNATRRSRKEPSLDRPKTLTPRATVGAWHNVVAALAALAALGCRDAAQAGAAELGSERAREVIAWGDSTSHIEGLASFDGVLYTADWKDGTIYEIDPAAPFPVIAGRLPTRPGQPVLGAAADKEGNLYFAIPDDGVVLRVRHGRLKQPTFNPQLDVTRFATGVPGANGLAFGPGGELWISGGDRHALYRVGPTGGAATVFARDYSPESTDTTVAVRTYTVNGVAVDSMGTVFTVNSGTGAISRLVMNRPDAPGSISVLARDPRLIGADGMIIDERGRLWLASNVRNALLAVSTDSLRTKVTEIWSNGASGPLRFPASLQLVARTVYLANLDLPLGVNAGTAVRRPSIAAVTPYTAGGRREPVEDQLPESPRKRGRRGQ